MRTWVPVLLLWLGALRLHKKAALPPAAAHLCVLLCSVLALSLAAMLNVLWYAAAALYAGLLAATLADVRRRGAKAWCRELRAFLTRPVLLWMAAAALLTVVFAVQQPLLTYWDEYQITGINARVMALSDQMYRVVPSSAAYIDDPCATAVLSYLYQFFGHGFSDSELYLSYGYLYLAVFAAAAEAVENKGAGRRAGTLFFAALIFTPFLQGYHTYLADFRGIVYGYVNAQADYMLAVGMFACAVLYLAAPHARWYWAAMAFTCLLKESGVLFTAVMALLLAVWRLPHRRAGRTAWLRWAAGTLVDLLGAMAGYLVWMVYQHAAGPESAASPLPGFAAAGVLAALWLCWRAVGPKRRAALRAGLARAGAAARLSLPALPAAAAALVAVLYGSASNTLLAVRIREALDVLGGLLLPSMRAQDWQQTLGMEVDAFFAEHLFTPLPDWGTVLLLCLLVLAACLWARTGAQRLRLLLGQAVLCLGAWEYLVTMAYFVRWHVSGQGMMEYPRYFTPYLFGWVYITVLIALCGPAPQGRTAKQLLAAACAVACVGQTAAIGLEHTVIAAPQNYMQDVRALRAWTREACGSLTPADRVYLVTGPLDTFDAMVASYELYPVVPNRPRADTAHNYETVFCAVRDPDDPYSGLYNQAAPAEFAALMQQNFDYIFVADDGGTWQADYGALFEGGVRAGTLYRVTGDAVPFVQVGP